MGEECNDRWERPRKKTGKKIDKMPSLKSSQLESAKLMAKQVITAMQTAATTLPHDSQVGLDKQTVEDVTHIFVPEEEKLCTRAAQSPQTPIVPSGKDVLDPSIVSAIKGIYKALLRSSQYPYCVAKLLLILTEIELTHLTSHLQDICSPLPKYSTFPLLTVQS